jgi:hypothetical protein
MLDRFVFQPLPRTAGPRDITVFVIPAEPTPPRSEDTVAATIERLRGVEASLARIVQGERGDENRDGDSQDDGHRADRFRDDGSRADDSQDDAGSSRWRDRLRNPLGRRGGESADAEPAAQPEVVDVDAVDAGADVRQGSPGGQ